MESHFELEGQIGSGLDINLIARAFEKYKSAPVAQSFNLIKKPDQQSIYDWLEADDGLYREVANSFIKVSSCRLLLACRS